MIKRFLGVAVPSLVLVTHLCLTGGSATAHHKPPVHDDPNNEHCPSVVCW